MINVTINLVCDPFKSHRPTNYPPLPPHYLKSSENRRESTTSTSCRCRYPCPKVSNPTSQNCNCHRSASREEDHCLSENNDLNITIYEGNNFHRHRSSEDRVHSCRLRSRDSQADRIVKSCDRCQSRANSRNGYGEHRQECGARKNFGCRRAIYEGNDCHRHRSSEDRAHCCRLRSRDGQADRIVKSCDRCQSRANSINSYGEHKQECAVRKDFGCRTVYEGNNCHRHRSSQDRAHSCRFRSRDCEADRIVKSCDCCQSRANSINGYGEHRQECGARKDFGCCGRKDYCKNDGYQARCHLNSRNQYSQTPEACRGSSSQHKQCLNSHQQQPETCRRAFSSQEARISASCRHQRGQSRASTAECDGYHQRNEYKPGACAARKFDGAASCKCGRSPDTGNRLAHCCAARKGLGGGLDCRRCGGKVYHAEMQSASGSAYHKICFSCFCCRKPLEPFTYHEHCGHVFCKQCYIRNFGPQGYGFGMGAGVLQTPL